MQCTTTEFLHIFLFRILRHSGVPRLLPVFCFCHPSYISVLSDTLGTCCYWCYSTIAVYYRDIYTRKWHSLQMIKLLEQWDSVKEHIWIITWLDIRSQLEKEVISSNGLLTHSLSVSISVGVLTGSVLMCVCWHREQSCSGTAWRCYWAAKVARTIPVVSKFILYVFFTRRFVLRPEAVPLVCVFQWSHVMDV